MALLHDQAGRQALTNLIFQCFDALKVYGKEPEQLENVNAMFQMILADYPIDRIKEAFVFYLKHSSELPAPADIVHIIERGNRPALEKAVYVSISKKEAEQRTASEWGYMRDYERFMITGEMTPAPPSRTNVNVI